MKEKIPVLHLDAFTENVSKSSFYVEQLSVHLKKNHALISHPHKHDFYLTVFFTHGKGIHTIDFQDHEVQEGAVFFLKPGQSHHWELSEDSEGYIFFHTEFSTVSEQQIQDFPFYSVAFNAPLLYLRSENILKFKTMFEALLQEFIENQTFKERKLSQLIDILYIDFSRLYEEKTQSLISITPNSYLNHIYHLERLIDEHYKAEKSPAQYAEWMYLTPKHLNRIVRETLNKTTSDLIGERVILEAKRLISHSKLSLAEIASELGYEEYAYFSRFFKKGAGETLTEFRKRYRK